MTSKLHSYFCGTEVLGDGTVDLVNLKIQKEGVMWGAASGPILYLFCFFYMQSEKDGMQTACC